MLNLPLPFSWCFVMGAEMLCQWGSLPCSSSETYSGMVSKMGRFMTKPWIWGFLRLNMARLGLGVSQLWAWVNWWTLLGHIVHLMALLRINDRQPLGFTMQSWCKREMLKPTSGEPGWKLPRCLTQCSAQRNTVSESDPWCIILVCQWTTFYQPKWSPEVVCKH